MLRLTILCENTAVAMPGLLAEHGFAVLIEHGGQTYLFDTGQSNIIISNAACLNKDLSRVSKIFLSHGHFDHTGGLATVLEQTGSVAVYAHPAVFQKRFAQIKKSSGKTQRNIGMPHTRDSLEALGADFVFNTAFSEVADGVFLTGEVPRESAFEKEDTRLVVEKDGKPVQDLLPDDQSLVIRTAKGLVVVLGCAHAGMINTLNHISRCLAGEKTHMVLGGTHMGFLNDEQVQKTIEALAPFSLERVGVSHCTGLAPAMKVMQAFGKRFFFANAGSVVTL